MAYLELINLYKKYKNDGPNIIEDMNLKIEKGKFISLLGPSGCGKTTTIRMISGLEEATSGDIKIDGNSVIDKKPQDRGVSMIFQSYALWPHMTVFQNVAYPLKLLKLNKKDIRSKVESALEKTDLIMLKNRYPSEMSGGQRQRVAVARAIVVEPKVFLMDEPLSNLDAKLRVVMRTELKKIHQEYEATTLFVTHDQSEAMSISDEIVIMNNGKIEQRGTPDEVYSTPSSRFVAEFIGNPPMNFFDAKFYYDDGINVISDIGKFSLNDKVNIEKLKKYNEQNIDLGIRPECLDIIPKFKDSVKLEDIKIKFIEPQGSHSILIFNVNGHEKKLITDPDKQIYTNSNNSLYLDLNKIGFYDKETGKRIN